MLSSLATLIIWPLPIVLGVGVALVGLHIAGPRIFHGTRPVAGTLRCPARHLDVQVGFEVDVWGGRRVEVDRCTAFTPATAVTCAKYCLHAGSLQVP